MKKSYQILIFLFSLGLSGLANAQPTILLDQQNLLDGTFGGQGIGCFSDITGDPDPECDQFDLQDAQGFTVGVDGQLARIKVPIRIVTITPTEDVTLEVFRQTSDGSPDEMQSLGAVDLPMSSFVNVETADPNTWPAFDFSSQGINVAIGQQLAYIVRSTDVSGYLYSAELGDESFLYAGGDGLRRNMAVDTSWSSFGHDYGFQTYVQTDIVLDQQNLLDGPLGGQGIGCFSDITGGPDPECDQFDFQDAQSFRVGRDGRLARIRVPVRYVFGQPIDDVHLEVVRLTVDGSPDDTQSLGSTVLPASSFADVDNNDPETWPAFDVASFGIDVTTGDELAYIVQTRDTETYLYNPEFGDESFLYASGSGFRRNAALDPSWGTPGTSDFGFQTFVIDTALTPGTVVFQVDMTREMRLGNVNFSAGEIVGVRGSVLPLSWEGTTQMLDADGDSVFTVAIPFSLPADTEVEYKFIQNIPGQDPGDGWEGSVGDGGDFGNRVLTYNGDETLEVVFFNNVTGVATEDGAVPTDFALKQNYPNPFSPRTVISYSLPEPAQVQLRVFDMLGRSLELLVDQAQAKGHYEITFDAQGLASGIYYYELNAGRFREVRKMILMQ